MTVGIGSFEVNNAGLSFDETNYLSQCWAVVVAQLIKRSLPIPEIRGSYPDIGKILSTYNTIEKTKIKKKEAGNGPSF